MSYLDALAKKIALLRSASLKTCFCYIIGQLETYSQFIAVYVLKILKQPEMQCRKDFTALKLDFEPPAKIDVIK